MNWEEDVIRGLVNLEAILERGRLVVNHAETRPILARLMEKCATTDLAEHHQPLVTCIMTLNDLEPKLTDEIGLRCFLNLINVAKVLSKLHFLVEMDSDGIRAENNVITAYRAVLADDTSFMSLVVVVSEYTSLPSHLSDGTIVKIINIHDASCQVMGVPTFDFDNDVAIPDDTQVRRAVQLLRLRDGPVLHSNVADYFALFTRGEWHIVVAVVGKGWVPVGETIINSRLYGHPTIVAEYRVNLLSKQWSSAEPQPQIGGAFGLTSSGMATIGPAVTMHDGRVGFVSTKHKFVANMAVGESAIVPGRDARILWAISASGAANVWPTFNATCGKVRTLVEAEVAYSALEAQYASFLEELPEEPTVVELVRRHENSDMALFAVPDEVLFSSLPMNWPGIGVDADPIYQLPRLELEGNHWKEEQLDDLEIGTHVRGHGAASGWMMGTVEGVSAAFGDMEALIFAEMNCMPGDSGSAIWTEIDGSRRFLGILRAIVNVTNKSNCLITRAWIIPAHLVVQFASA